MSRKKSKNKNKPESTPIAEEVDSIQAQLEECRSEISNAKDKYLRLFAEFENYKKRTLKERIDLINTASQDTIKAILPVLDDFTRAKKSAEDPTTDESFSEGVALVYTKLFSTVEQLGLKQMDTEDLTFNDEIHDAITHIPVDDPSKDGKIIDIVEPGYTLNGKIIRYAKVVVGKYNQ